MSVSLLRLYLSDPSPAPAGKSPVFTDTQLKELLERAENDVNSAAAEGWRIKAGSVADWYDVSLDGSVLSRDQVWKHCMNMVSTYEALSGGQMKNVRIQVTPEDESETSEFA